MEKGKSRFYLYSLIIYLLLAGLAYLILYLTNPEISFLDISILLSGGLIITSISYYIFSVGSDKGEGKPVLYTLISIGVKFLLYLVLLLVYVLSSDNLSIPFLITFFIIYLSFTSYLLLTFVSLLKSKKQTVPDDNEN